MFKVHLGMCIDCNKVKTLVVKALRCDQCNYAFKQAKKGLSVKSKAISFMSDKRKVENKEYLKVREEYLLEHPKCEANIVGVCSKKATDIHHTVGRTGKLLTERKYFLAVCRACHSWIENHPQNSVELEFSGIRTNKK